MPRVAPLEDRDTWPGIVVVHTQPGRKVLSHSWPQKPSSRISVSLFRSPFPPSCSAFRYIWVSLSLFFHALALFSFTHLHTHSHTHTMQPPPKPPAIRHIHSPPPSHLKMKISPFSVISKASKITSLLHCQCYMQDDEGTALAAMNLKSCHQGVKEDVAVSCTLVNFATRCGINMTASVC